MDNSVNAESVGMLIGAIVFLLLFFLPTIVAYNRNHAYKHIILVLNIFGFTGIIWIIAMIWAIFPSEKSLIDPIVGNVTGTGIRNAGDTIGAANYGAERGYAGEKNIAPTSFAQQHLNSSKVIMPGMIACFGCGNSVHESATSCPACGAVQKKIADNTETILIPAVALGFSTISIFAFSDDVLNDTETILVFTSAAIIGLLLGVACIANQKKGKRLAVSAIVVSVGILTGLVFMALAGHQF